MVPDFEDQLEKCLLAQLIWSLLETKSVKNRILGHTILYCKNIFCKIQDKFTVMS